jgi:exodeoxyribonuclease VII large subunit
MIENKISLVELNSLVRRSLESCLPDTYWVQAELSDVRTNATGHCYLEFIQKDERSSSMLAKARGIIWSNVFGLIKPYFEELTGQTFHSGLKVLVEVSVNFHEPTRWAIWSSNDRKSLNSLKMKVS